MNWIFFAGILSEQSGYLNITELQLLFYLIENLK